MKETTRQIIEFKYHVHEHTWPVVSSPEGIVGLPLARSNKLVTTNLDAALEDAITGGTNNGR